MQILQDCLHSNEMLAIYLLEFGTDMPSNITKKDLISIIFKISRRKDLISVIMFLCQKLDWIATKEDGVLTKETQESDKKLTRGAVIQFDVIIQSIKDFSKLTHGHSVWTGKKIKINLFSILFSPEEMSAKSAWD